MESPQKREVAPIQKEDSPLKFNHELMRFLSEESDSELQILEKYLEYNESDDEEEPEGALTEEARALLEGEDSQKDEKG